MANESVYRSPLTRQLEAYEEAWREDHEEVKRCWHFEDQLEIGIGLFRVIHDRSMAWRQRVFRGVEPVSQEADEAWRDCFQRWLRPCKRAEQRLAHFERLYGAVAHAADFRECVRHAWEILDN